MTAKEVDALLRKLYQNSDELENLYQTHLKSKKESKFFDYEYFSEKKYNGKINYLLGQYSHSLSVLIEAIKAHREIEKISNPTPSNNTANVKGDNNIIIQKTDGSNINITISK